MSAFASSFVAPYLGGASSRTIRTAKAAILGGTVFAIVGGKFANGAVTAAFVHLFNAEAKKFFKTQHSAAKAALNKIYNRSCKENVEWGGPIYKKGNQFYYGSARTDNSTDSVNIYDTDPSSGAKIVGYYHTHAAYDPKYDSENFSGSSGDIGFANDMDWDAYVATPGGAIKYYPHDEDAQGLKDSLHAIGQS